MEEEKLSSDDLEEKVESIPISDKIPDYDLDKPEDEKYNLKVIDKDDFKEIPWVDFVQW